MKSLMDFHHASRAKIEGMTGRRLERLSFPGPAGRLEGILHRRAEARSFAALVSHPHPLRGGGGTMDNKVTYRLARGLEESGGLVLRYNFRGAGRSEGKHDDGRGEQDDLKAALRFLRSQGGTGLPTLLAGFSFGSYMSLLVALQDPDVDALLLVGVPALTYDLSMLAEVDRPIALIQGEFDEHGPLQDLERVWRDVPEPKSLRVVPGAGHFFDDEQVELMQAVVDAARGPVLASVLGLS